MKPVKKTGKTTEVTQSALHGVVISDKMAKTITVKVVRMVQHPTFSKIMHKVTIIKAHDEKDEAKVGDQVEIVPTRPLSKTKTWRMVRITKKAVKKDEVQEVTI
ncbi:MAG: 30S ribosomal protein S17 [Planctomycetes bacterium]|nr:30S ribosomal protein S17 [Planctomycetota bacterium]